jgi:dolichol-phosphate mannosyltransferase
VKKISVVVPAFNEEECVDELAKRLISVADSLNGRYAFEFVIVENGSHDSTFAKLLRIHQKDRRFKVLRLSRNFGIEGAVTAGLRCIDGDAALIMCADLQDPPELIPQLLEQWERGYDNVYGIIKNRSDEGRLRRALTRVFYWLANSINEQPIPQNVSDFRLVDRSMYQTLNQLNEKNRMLRAMWAWIGGRSIGVPFDRPPRHGGKSTYALLRNIAFAVRGLMSSSTTPLKAIPLFGIALSFFSFLVLIGFAIRWYVKGVPFNGFGTILALMLLLFGLLFLLLGMVSEYVGLIFEEVRSRPIFITRDRLGWEEDSAYPASSIGKEFDETPVL